MARGYLLGVLRRYNMSDIGKYTFKINKLSTNSMKHGVDFYTGHAQPVEELREFLGKFEGGKIDLQLNNENGIARLVLNNPNRRNAITGKMMVEFEKAIETLETWDEGKGVIVHGAEGSFCSGGDLEFAKKTGNADDGFKMATFMQNVLNRLETLPLISVAFINGSGALGGGAEVAVSCDFRLMTPHENTGFGFVHSKMGIVPAWGGAGRLVRLIGKQNGLDMLSTARIVRHDEGIRLGLVNGAILCLGDAEKWLLERVKSNKSVVRTLKCLVLNAVYNTEDPQDVESRLFSPLWGGVANKAALDKNIKHRTNNNQQNGKSKF